jgi:hypothetical protein
MISTAKSLVARSFSSFSEQLEKRYYLRRVQRPLRTAARSVDRGLRQNTLPADKVGGIFGLLDRRSKAETAIHSAFKDGMLKVIIFGHILDGEWFCRSIAPLFAKYQGRLFVAGTSTDRQAMYDMVSDVYEFSGPKTANAIREECALCGRQFHGK